MNIRPTLSLALLLSAAFSLSACGDDEPPTPLDCGEFGEAHGDHCHCSDGYVATATTCVEVQAPLDCGEFGDAHEDHCHCDPGFEEVDGTCEATTEPCGPHGTIDGDICVCDEGYHNHDGWCEHDH